jgi:hypothetical protein
VLGLVKPFRVSETELVSAGENTVVEVTVWNLK